jgi:hypothetical protein
MMGELKSEETPVEELFPSERTPVMSVPASLFGFMLFSSTVKEPVLQ